MQLIHFNIPILSYHKIDTTFELGINIVRPQQFRKQMTFLKAAGYTAINFKQAYSEKLPEKPIIITFDDGYESVYNNAWPILKEFDFTAVIFVITDYIGQYNNWDANLGGIKFKHLDRKQILDLHHNGIEIGSHTRSHRSLIHMPASGISEELGTSKAILEEMLETSVTSVAYPFGECNSQVLSIAKKCGYQFGVVNIWQNSDCGCTCNLRRIPVYQTDSLYNFKAKLSKGFLNKLELLKLHAISWPARLTPYYQKIFGK